MERVNGDNVYFYGAAFSIPFPEVRGTEYFLEVTNLTDPEWGWHETNYCDYIDGGLCPILDYPAIGVPWDFPVWGTYSTVPTATTWLLACCKRRNQQAFCFWVEDCWPSGEGRREA